MLRFLSHPECPYLDAGQPQRRAGMVPGCHFSIAYVTCGCEKLEEPVPIFIEFARIHQLVVQPLVTIDGDLDFRPHRMGGAALLRTTLVTDPSYLSTLELINDLVQICCTLHSLDLQLTARENGSVSMAESVRVHGNVRRHQYWCCGGTGWWYWCRQRLWAWQKVL